MSTTTTDSKLILVSGTDSGIGTTCIMNYVALELAKKGTVLYIEFKRKTGFSIYMHRGHHERRRSLTEVITIPERLPDNVIRSPHIGSMFYLCMNMYEDSLKLQDYQSFKIIDIVKEAKRIFDFVILDLPADPSEPAVGVTFGKDFIYKPDHTLLFLDERVSSYKYLNDFNAILALAGETSPRDVTFVINKVATAHYQDYIEDYLPSLPLTKPTNKVWLPFLPELITATNKGRIYETGINKESKLFFSQVSEISKIIIEDKRGVNITKRTVDSNKVQKEGKGLLGKVFKKKIDTLETQEEKAEHNRRVDAAFNMADDVGINKDFESEEEKHKFVSENLFSIEEGWEDYSDDMVLIPARNNLNPVEDYEDYPYELYDDYDERPNPPTGKSNPKKKSGSLFGPKSKRPNKKTKSKQKTKPNPKSKQRRVR